MRIRFWLYLTFGLFSIIPLLLMGWWAHTSLIQNELTRSGKTQLALAETHADSITRYLNEQSRSFEMYALDIEKTDFTAQPLLKESTSDLDRIMIADLSNGKLVANIGINRRLDDKKFSEKILPQALFESLSENSSFGKTTVSALYQHPNGKNYVYLSTVRSNKLIIGELGTTFFTKLASGTRIGASGHAAIFDNEGNLIAHPNATWQKSGKNIGSLSPVKIATTGKSGVVEFFSPALETSMLAGVANIQGVNWGVMIPRTIADITNDTGFAKKSASFIFVLIMAAILLGAIIVSNFISKPMERLTRTLKRIGRDGNLGNFRMSENKLMPTENMELEKSFSRMSENLRETHDKMKTLAYSDGVTSLPNRDAFNDIVEQSLSFMANTHMNGAVLFIDMDNFKEINEGHGHNVGDQILRSLGARFASILELNTGSKPTRILDSLLDEAGAPKPCIARFGGDEFVVFIPENNGLSKLDDIADQLLEAAETPIPSFETNIKLTGKIGIASFPQHGLTVQDLVRKADIAVTHAKTVGSDPIQKFGDGTGDFTLGEIRRDVHLAIKNNELELYYQPKINTETNEVRSVEALVRWFHPVNGLISPSNFIPAIENSDITNELGEWVMKRACSDMQKWVAEGRELNIAVNIAARQFGSEEFVEKIHQIVIENGCEPTRFEIEVTEETALARSENANDIISKLHSLGFRVSLDDYGRGYSNLTRLSDLRVNTIKIDGPLTARLTRDERTRVIFEATINMAKGLQCETVAEGVETADEVAILTKLGCTELQGFYFATPMPQSAVVKWINDREATPVKDLQDRIRVAM